MRVVGNHLLFSIAMSSSKGSSSRTAEEAGSSSSRRGNAHGVPFTPKPSHRRKTNKQLSAKQLDKVGQESAAH